MTESNEIIEQRESGRIIATAGASQSGKTTLCKKELNGCKRLLVWDVRGEWPVDPNITAVTRISTRAQLWGATGDKYAGRYAYVPSAGNLAAEFDYFCRIAYLWGQLFPATIFADEIADVTNAAKAPDAWGQLLRKGKFYGNVIYGVSQFPAESDKTLWRNADVLRSFRVVADNDRDYMARRVGISPGDFPGENYKYVQMVSGDTRPTFHNS